MSTFRMILFLEAPDRFFDQVELSKESFRVVKRLE